MKQWTVQTVNGEFTAKFRVYNDAYPQGEMYYGDRPTAETYQGNVWKELGIPMEVEELEEEERVETKTQYRVWADVGSHWMAVSRLFDTERDAEIWALRLTLEHRVEPEDAE